MRALPSRIIGERARQSFSRGAYSAQDKPRFELDRGRRGKKNRSNLCFSIPEILRASRRWGRLVGVVDQTVQRAWVKMNPNEVYERHEPSAAQAPAHDLTRRIEAEEKFTTV